MKIEGAHAIVTGAASGLGAATAETLAAKGAKVSVLDFNGEGAAAKGAELGGFGVKVDVSDEGSVEAAINAATDKFGAPRIIVNCAGIGTAARIIGREGKLSIDVFERTFKVNLLGTYIVMSYGVRAMQTLDPLEGGERGVVVNTASVAFEDGQFGQAAYAAAKGGIVSLSLPAARELSSSGIRVMAIAPGLFETPMMQGLPPEVTEQITANIPFPNRLGSPAEYGLLVSQIVENSYLNGTTIRLDAAVRLPRR